MPLRSRLLPKLHAFIRTQLLCCLFPIAIFATLAASKFFAAHGLLPLPRYDFILLVCLGVQAGLYYTRLETKRELLVIGAFHILGLMLELWKTAHGSWSYPEDAWFKIGGVPLYSGFMYASVGSYICAAWRRFRLQMLQLPGAEWMLLLGTAIYLNFFTKHLLPDARWLLIGALFLVFARTKVRFTMLLAEGNVAKACTHQMPLSLSFVLIGFFIWVAENIATFFGAWQYPHQQQMWQLVHTDKISSWFLLVVVSFVAVALLKTRETKEALLQRDFVVVTKPLRDRSQRRILKKRYTSPTKFSSRAISSLRD